MCFLMSSNNTASIESDIKTSLLLKLITDGSDKLEPIELETLVKILSDIPDCL
jgi:hypothetical protein